MCHYGINGKFTADFAFDLPLARHKISDEAGPELWQVDIKTIAARFSRFPMYPDFTQEPVEIRAGLAGPRSLGAICCLKNRCNTTAVFKYCFIGSPC
jgi:hypothetical protein